MKMISSNLFLYSNLLHLILGEDIETPSIGLRGKTPIGGNHKEILKAGTTVSFSGYLFQCGSWACRMTPGETCYWQYKALGDNWDDDGLFGDDTNKYYCKKIESPDSFSFSCFTKDENGVHRCDL